MRNQEKYSNYSQDTRKIRKILNEEARLGINAESDSDTEEGDLNKELHPLSHYINNREEMIEQMFSIIKGAKLKKMLPPILKDLPLDELKADCLIHLLGMSTKRILAILEATVPLLQQQHQASSPSSSVVKHHKYTENKTSDLAGREINSSSDSETNSDSSASPSKRSKIAVKPIIVKQEGCSDISDNSEEVVLVDPDCELINSSSNKKQKHSSGDNCNRTVPFDLPLLDVGCPTGSRLEDLEETESGSGRKSKKRTRVKHKKNGDGNKKPEKSLIIAQTSGSKQRIETVENISSLESSSDEENDGEPAVPTGGKNLLEILELEMRARAIRALLQNSGTSVTGESENVENQPSQSRSNQTDVGAKPSNDGKKHGEKVTPVKNFRRKKRKSDDVIVITPKLITIDLTDENDPNYTRNKVITEPPNKSPNVDNVEEENDLSKVKTVTNNDSCVGEKDATAELVPINNMAKEVLDHNIRGPQQKADQSKNNWTQRWLESKEVKNVVTTSKIYGNIRKKIRSAKFAKKNQENLSKVPTEPTVIHGSVNEYDLLSKTKTVADSNVGCINSVDEANTFLASAEGSKPVSDKHSTLQSVDQVQYVTSTKNEAEKNTEGFTDQNSMDTESNAYNSKYEQEIDNCIESVNLETDLSNTAKSKSSKNSNINTKLKGSSPILNVLSEVEDPNVDHSQSTKANINDIQLENVISTVTEDMNSEAMDTCSSQLLDSRENRPYGCEVAGTVEALNPGQSGDSSEKSGINYSLLSSEDNQNESSKDEVKSTIKVSEVAVAKNQKSYTSITQENELETLEINITDEDRDIDGIIDDKLEIDESSKKIN